MAMAFFSLLSQAQFIEKDKRVIGGSLGLGFHTNNDSTQVGGNKSMARSFSVNLSPSYGKAIKADLVFGYYAILSFDSYRLEQSQYAANRKSNGYQFGGGLFLEKFFSLSNRLAVSGRLSGGASYSSFIGKDYSQNIWTGTDKTKNISAGISLSPMLNYRLTQKLLVGLSANDFASVNYVKGRVESSGLNTVSKKSEYSSFSASTLFNYSKLLQDVRFSFRFFL